MFYGINELSVGIVLLSFCLMQLHIGTGAISNYAKIA